MTPEISIIVPVFNEEENLHLLAQRVQAVMDEADLDFELVLVDDGSTDGSLQIIKGLATSDPRIRYFSFSRNFGHEAASTCGLNRCRGKAAVLMDADLQDPPELIPGLVAKWREGYEVVHLRRTSREGEGPFKRLTSHFFYRLLNSVSDASIPVDVGDFRLVDRQVIDQFNALGERRRFVRGLFPWIGFRQAVLEYQRPARARGKTKYDFLKRVALSLDALTGFSITPLRLCIATGFAVTLLSLAIALVIVVQRVFFKLDMPGYALLTAGMFLLGGVQLTFLGVVGEYIGKIFIEVQARPLYIVRQSSDTETGGDG